MAASIKHVEDHGYSVNLGFGGLAGFLSFKEAKKATLGLPSRKLPIGLTIDVCVTKRAENGRIHNVTVDPTSLCSALVSTRSGSLVLRISNSLGNR